MCVDVRVWMCLRGCACVKMLVCVIVVVCVNVFVQDRERFWYIEDVDLTTLFPLFMAWAKTMGSSLRKELQDIGDALHEGRMDEVSRGIQ